MGLFNRVSLGLSKSRTRLKEQMNVLLKRGPNLDDDFWDKLEESLILADMGASSAEEIVFELQQASTRQALPDASAVIELLEEKIADKFCVDKDEILKNDKLLLLFVGINGTGKTTTVGKLAFELSNSGKKVVLGNADTFRAAAAEQLDVWARRSDAVVISKERGSDPASVCYATIEEAEACGADLVLIDTAGRLHTSSDLMRELQKVVGVVRKRSNYPTFVVLVIDATTGQNGLIQAREFNDALDLDALVITKLDSTAKGGIALAISKELSLPVIKIGVGEGVEDLQNFDPRQFAHALIGMDVDDIPLDDSSGGDLDTESTIDTTKDLVS